jgi:hypothetical protein
MEILIAILCYLGALSPNVNYTQSDINAKVMENQTAIMSAQSTPALITCAAASFSSGAIQVLNTPLGIRIKSDVQVPGSNLTAPTWKYGMWSGGTGYSWKLINGIVEPWEEEREPIQEIK